MPKPISPAKPSVPGVKCVLLVVHEDAARLTAKWTLTDFGYLVDVAGSAEEALTLFDPAVHDAVVTGDTMPGITGTELAHIVKLRSPRTPVVLLARTAPPTDHSCLDAVLEKGPRAWGLPAVLQQLLAGVVGDANSASRKTRARARRRRKLAAVSVPEGLAPALMADSTDCESAAAGTTGR